MVELNTRLIERAEKVIQGAGVLEALDRYRAAYRLARGPDPKRALRWAVLTAERERTLKVAVGQAERGI